MSHSRHPVAQPICAGPDRFPLAPSRRRFLRTGLAGFATLSLPQILKLQSQHALYADSPTQSSREK